MVTLSRDCHREVTVPLYMECSSLCCRSLPLSSPIIRPDSIGQPSPMPQYGLHVSVSVYQHVCMHVYIQISLWMMVAKNQ